MRGTRSCRSGGRGDLDRSGVYREVLKIAKPNISWRSPYTDPKKTVVVFDKSNGTAGGTHRRQPRFHLRRRQDGIRKLRDPQHSARDRISDGARQELGGEDSGYVFDHCKLTAEPGVEHVWLGRPWRPYATAIFLNTEMGAHIEPAGWRERHPGETKSIETAFFAEYNSSGPGAHAAECDPHTHHLTATEAARYETGPYLSGSDNWRPIP